MPTVAEFIIDRLQKNGVRHMFNVPGDYSLGFCKRVEESKIQLVGTTNEENAGFAADAYARVRGLSAVCVTYCVGGFKVLNPIGGAFAEKSPVVVISGSPGLKERNSEVLLHHMVGEFGCQHSVFKNVTCASAVLDDPTRAAYEVDRLFEAAKHYKQPVYLELPRDMVDRNITYDAYTIGTPPSVRSDQENLREVLAEVRSWIDGASKPVIWAGVEIARYGLGSLVTKFAEMTGIPVATDILGKSVINERHPLSLGVYSESTSNDSVLRVFSESDCVIMLGVMVTDMNLGFLPLKCLRRNTIKADSRTMQVRNHTYDGVGFVDFVRGLCEPGLRRRPVERTAPVVPAFKSVAEAPLTAVRLFEKINSILTEDMAVVADVGDSLFGSLDVTVHRQNQFLAPAFYTSMGFAMPGSLGVQLANPDLRPIVIVGDGAFQMTGQEFSTLVRLGLNPIVFVLNNGGYGTERILLEGAFNDIQPWAFEKMPLLVGGGRAAKAETEGELEVAVSAALATRDQPYLINCVVAQGDHSPALQRMFSKLAKRI